MAHDCHSRRTFPNQPGIPPDPPPRRLPAPKDLANWAWPEFKVLYDQRQDGANHARHYHHPLKDYDSRTWTNARRRNPINRKDCPDAGPLGKKIITPETTTTLTEAEKNNRWTNPEAPELDSSGFTVTPAFPIAPEEYTPIIPLIQVEEEEEEAEPTTPHTPPPTTTPPPQKSTRLNTPCTYNTSSTRSEPHATKPTNRMP